LQGKLHSMVSKCYVKYSILNSKNVRKRSASKFNQNTYFIKIRNITLYRIPGNLFTSYKTRRGAVFIILRNFVSVIFNYSYLWLHLWVIVNVHSTYIICIILNIFFFYLHPAVIYYNYFMVLKYLHKLHYKRFDFGFTTWVNFIGEICRLYILYRYFLKFSDLHNVNCDGSWWMFCSYFLNIYF